MNKYLKISWTIIIIGSIFIAIQVFSPSPQQNDNLDLSNLPEVQKTQEEVIDIELPENYTELIRNGDRFFAEGEFKIALKNYQRALSLDPQNIELLTTISDTQLKNNQANEAKKTIQKALEIKPKSLELKLKLVQSYFNLREIEKAKELIFQLDEDNLQVQNYKGIILILAGEYDQAEKTFKKLSKSEDQELAKQAQKYLNAKELFTYFQEGEEIHLKTLMAKALSENEQYEAAIPLLFSVIEEKLNYRDAWIVLGYSYLNTGKNQDAIDALTQALVLDDEKAETLFFLGLSYLANEDINKAIFYIEKAEKAGFQPQEQVQLKLGELYTIKENYDQAASKFENLLSSNPDSLNIFVRAVYLNIDKIQNPTKALEIAKSSLIAHPDSAMGYNLIGWALTAKGEYELAENYLNKALNIDPRLDAANLNLGWLYEKKGVNMLAREYYKKAYSLGQGNEISKRASQRFNGLKEI
ncbi:tetratricopeptide repeat protein [Candidatus Gracilibacteria bacterium]|nr:tetratricopeptide repeat protein [Candidatus Gracilibacteria bacterium]